jgi:hypothetical protein
MRTPLNKTKAAAAMSLRSAVEARQGFSSRRIFYVPMASLALVIVAYAIIAGFVPR